MKRSLYLIIYMALALLSACDVHEWPEKPKEIGFSLDLVFDTFMDKEDYYYNNGIVSRAADAHDMRYIIRAYPLGDNDVVLNEPVAEWIYSRGNVSVGDNYDYSTQYFLPEGKYRLMAWADFVEAGSVSHKYYNYDNFTSIVLHGPHKANTDYRDAFSGTADLTLEASIYEELETKNVLINMKRPFAKYSFVATDLKEFMEKEMKEQHGEVDLDDYTVLFIYPMYMPNTYNLFNDKAVNSATGIQYRSKLTPLNEKEASMGFDYVVINDDPDAKVTVRVGVFDKDGKQLAMSPSFNIPLERSVNSIIRGRFLMTESDGGISIDPSFNGDHNIVLP